MTEFEEKVYNIVRNIRRGKTMTYIEVAKAAGYPRAARAVGNALNKNYDKSVPCHRVIRSDGKIGGYNRGFKLKAELLEREKVKFKMLEPKSKPNNKTKPQAPNYKQYQNYKSKTV